MDWIRGLYRVSRGAELPGTVNPRVLENMFRQQSGPWKSIATVYVERIATAIRNFNDAIFEEKVVDDDLRQKLAAKLSQGHEVAHEKAKQIFSLSSATSEREFSRL